MVEFGHKFRKQYYNNISHEVYPVNHGSFGNVPDHILEKYLAGIRGDNHFLDKSSWLCPKDSHQTAVQAIAPVVGSDWRRLAFVPNATTGVNTVLRSYPLVKGDVIVISSTLYKAVINTVNFLENHIGIKLIVVPLDYPMSDDEVVEKFRKVFEAENPKLALFDTVSLGPGVLVPFQRLVRLCKKFRILSLVDGAHGIGLVPLNLNELEPDFFTTNLHKWYGMPKGTALLYIDPKHLHLINTFPVSWSYLEDPTQLSDDQQATRMLDMFAFTGTLSYAAYNLIDDMISFRNVACGGEEHIQRYCWGLAETVGETVSKKWNTEVLENSQKSLTTAMVNVKVPLDKIGITIDYYCANVAAISNEYNHIIMEHYSCWVPLCLHNKGLYARFSAQIYTELLDFEYAGDKVIQALTEAVNSVKMAKIHV